MDSTQAAASADELERMFEKAIKVAVAQLSAPSAPRFRSAPSPRALSATFSGGIPKKGLGLEALFEELQKKVVANSTRIGSRRFFGIMDPPPLPIAIAAEVIASSLNQNLANWTTSPAATAVELQVISWFAELAGIKEAGGIMVSSGSVGNLLSLRCARNHRFPEAAAGGLHGMTMPGKPKVYCSEHAHSSLEKAMDVLGLGHGNLRRVATDGKFRMRMDELERALREDEKRGDVPVCVVATAGTTLTGAIDPLEEIARLCREREIWFHVDASYAGATLLSERGKGRVAGIAGADSFVIDPHKWLYIPFQAAVFVCRADVFRSERVGRSGGYVYEAPEGAVNLSDFGLQGSKRFDALKVWLALKLLGTEGYAKFIEKDLANARYFWGLLAESKIFEALAEPELGIVAFRLAPRSPSHRNEKMIDRATSQLYEEVMKTREVWLNLIRLDGRPALQASFNNFMMTRDDVDALYAALKKATIRPGR